MVNASIPIDQDKFDYWEEVQTTIEQIEGRITHKILPNSLSGSFAELSKSEIDELRKKREQAKSTITNIKNTGNSLNNDMEEMIEYVKMEGGTLPPEAISTTEKSQEIISKIEVWKNDPRPLLTSDEETQLISLKSTLETHMEYVSEKQEFDQSVKEIQADFDNANDKIDQLTSKNNIISDRRIERIESKLKNLQHRIESVKSDIDTSILTQPDLDQLNSLDSEVSNSQNTLREYNQNIVNKHRDDLLSNINSFIDENSDVIDKYRSFDQELTIDIGKVIKKCESQKNKISAFLSEEREQYLSSESIERLTQLQGELDKIDNILSTKQEYDSSIEELEKDIADIEKKVKSVTSKKELISEETCIDIETKAEKIESRIEFLHEKLNLDLLSDSDLDRLDSMESEVSELTESIRDHNSEIVNKEASATVEKFSPLSNRILKATDRYQSDERPLEFDIEDTIVQITSGLDQVSEYLSTPQRQYLNDSNTQALTEIKEKLTDSEEFLETKFEFDTQIKEIRDSIEPVEERLSKVEKEDEMISKEVYSEIDEELANAEFKIDSISDELNNDLLSSSDGEKIESIENKIEQLYERLQNHNYTVANRWARDTYNEISPLSEKLSNAINQYQSEGQPLKISGSKTEIVEKIDSGLERIEDSLSGRQEKYLTDQNHSKLVDTADSLESAKDVVQIKTEFDSKISSIKSEITTVEEDLDPTKETSDYLTTTQEKEYRTLRKDLTSEFNHILELDDLEMLSSKDLHSLGRVEHKLRDLSSEIDNYNQIWLEEMCDKYETELNSHFEDPVAEHTEQQLNAIFRNDNFNRVNAAAGTGKTTTLGRRVFFILAQFDEVTPQDVLSITFTKNGESEMEKEFEDIGRFTERDLNIKRVDAVTLNSYAKSVVEDKYDDIRFVVGEAKLTDIELIWNNIISESEWIDVYEEFIAEWKEQNYDPDDKKEINSIYENHLEKSSLGFLGEDIGTDDIPEESLAHKEITRILNAYQLDYVYKYTIDWDSESKTEYTVDFLVEDKDIDGQLFIEYSPSSDTRRDRPHYKNPAYESVSQLRNYFERLEGSSTEATTGTLITISGSDILSSPADEIYWSEAAKRSFKSEVAEVFRAKLGKMTTFAPSEDEALSEFKLKEAVYDKTICERNVVDTVEDFIQQIRVREWSYSQAKDNVEAYIENAETKESVAAFYRLCLEAYQRFNELYDNRFRTDFHGSLELTRDLLDQDDVEDSHIYRHILVDEMQDLNPVQFDLIKSLTTVQDDARVFGVGDDWQSIFGFRGARPDLFINYKDNLGAEDYADTQLEANHRCPDTVVNTSNEFIRHNQVRTTKDPEGRVGGDPVNVHHLGCDTYNYIVNKETVNKILKLIQSTPHEPKDTQVLLRQKDGDQIFYHQLKNRLDETVNKNGEGRVDIRTAHDAKGSEAEHVIIPKVIGKGGYPSGKSDKWVKPVKKPPEAYVTNDANYQIEEERRLFYVALTRSTDRVDIITIVGAESQFIDELPSSQTVHNRPLPQEELDEIRSNGEIRRTVTGKVDSPPEGNNYATINWDDGGLIDANLWDASDLQKSKLKVPEGTPVTIFNCGIEFREADRDHEDVDTEKLQLQVDSESEVEI